MVFVTEKIQVSQKSTPFTHHSASIPTDDSKAIQTQGNFMKGATIFNFLKIHQFSSPFSLFAFNLKLAQKFAQIYGNSHYDHMIAFLD